MKTSFVLVIAILTNTTLLLSEPLVFISEHINNWVLIMIESVLILGLYVHRILQGLKNGFDIEMGELNIFAFKSKTGKKENLF